MPESRQQPVYPLNDKPTKRDECKFEERIVNRIFNFIETLDPPMSIAVTGEWGIGKTTVLDFLEQKIKHKNSPESIIIRFEPLLDGKLEIADIIEIFYLKLYKQLSNSEAKETIKKILKSMSLVFRCKATISASLPLVSKVSIEKDFGKDINDVLKLWDQEKPQLFTEQARELNKHIKKQILYIFIDEIDRLPSEQMINFLLFCRILETFDNLACIIGIDYGNVLKKLCSEGYIGLGNYDIAKTYLEKLAQINFHIYINDNEKIEFVNNRLKKIDKEKVLYDSRNIGNYQLQKELSETIELLKTPRQLKKWLLLINNNYPIIKYTPEKLTFIKFLACIVIHPIISENLSNYTMPLLKEKFGLQITLRDKYGIDTFSSKKSFNKESILLASLGLIRNRQVPNTETSNLTWEEEFYNRYPNKITSTFPLIIKYAENFLKLPTYLIHLMVMGYFDEEGIAAYYNFFENDINSTLNILLQNSDSSDLLVSDLADTLSNNIKYCTTTIEPDLTTLVKLWRSKCEYSFMNPYYYITLFSLKKIKILHTIIEDADLSMSEVIVLFILDTYGIRNENGTYNIENFTDPENDIACFEDAEIKKKEDITDIIKQWLAKVKATLQNPESKWFEQTNLISVFYRYVQLGDATDINNRLELTQPFLNFIKNDSIPLDSRIKIVKLIIGECATYIELRKKPKVEKNPLEILFENNIELNKEFKGFAQSHNLKNIQYFDKIALLEKSAIE